MVVYLKSYFRDLSKISSCSYYKVNLLLWFILLSTNVIDMVFTYYVIQGNGVEMNPFMAFLGSTFGNISMALYKGLLIGVLFFLLPYVVQYLQKLLYVSVIVYVLLVFSHFIRFI